MLSKARAHANADHNVNARADSNAHAHAHAPSFKTGADPGVDGGANVWALSSLMLLQVDFLISRFPSLTKVTPQGRCPPLLVSLCGEFFLC